MADEFTERDGRFCEETGEGRVYGLLKSKAKDKNIVDIKSQKSGSPDR